MQKVNYQLELDKLIKQNEKDGVRPSVLLHVCCAPCASYCLEYLTQYFNVSVLYYNPNITNQEEYMHRKGEVEKLVKMYEGKVDLIEAEYDTSKFLNMAKGMEQCKEGGERCLGCYALRLSYTAKKAKELNIDYFCSSLSISPHKNSQVLNQIGEKVGENVGIKHLPNDFKKKEGFKRSCYLAEKYGFYRQDYCGCDFSKRD